MNKTVLKNESDSPKIVPTTDETMMSNYRGGMIVGLQRACHKGLSLIGFFPRVVAAGAEKKWEGSGRDFGLRSCQASLAKEFGEDEVAVVHPYD